MSDLAHARAWLFTPASRPDRFAGALESGADAVILDLEDAVAEAEKVAARRNVLEFLNSAPSGRAALFVRMNALTRTVGLEDLAALARVPGLAGVLIPKLESGETIRLASAVLEDARSPARIAGLIESARGVAALADIAAAGGRLASLMFGAADYSADLGQRVGEFRAEHARAALVNAAAANRLTAIDAPCFTIGELDVVAQECREGRALGFFGKAAIHPAHLSVIREVFAPRAEEVAQARRVLEAAPAGVGVLDGRMIDEAMLRWARRIAGTP